MKRKRHSQLVQISLLLVSFLALGCTGEGPAKPSRTEPATGVLQLLLTDSPLEGNVEAINVSISRVDVVFADESMPDESIIPPNTTFNLLDLHNGVTAPLGIAELPVGLISQLRLIIKEASITVDGETSDVFIPSGERTGVKLNGEFEISPCFVTTVTIDFDAKKSVRLPPGLEQGHAQKYLLQPVISAVSVESDFDTTPPVIAFSPADGSFVNENPVAMMLSLTNGTGVDATSFEAILNGVDVTRQFSVNPESAEATLVALEGNNMLQVTLGDICGNVGTSTVSFFVDTVDPEILIDKPFDPLPLIEAGISIEIDRPLIPGIFVNTPEVPVEGPVSDVGSGIAEVLVNGNDAIVADERFSATAQLAEGTNTLEAVVRDRAGNEDVAVVEVIRDTIPPDPAVLDPVPGSTNQPLLSVTGTGEPGCLALAAVGSQVSGALIGDDGRFAVNVSLVADVSNTISITLVDPAGNRSSPATAQAFFNAPPRVNIEAPRSGLATSAVDLDVSGTALDTDLATVLVNGMAASLQGAGFVRSGVRLEPGLNTITVEIIDGFPTVVRRTIEVYRANLGEVVPDAFGFIASAQGGVVEVMDSGLDTFGARVEIGPDAITADALVTIALARGSLPRNPRHIPVGPPVNLDLGGAEILAGSALEITLPYRYLIADAVGRRHDLIEIFRLDSATQVWEPFDTRVDASYGLIEAAITRASIIQAFMENPTEFRVETIAGNGDKGDPLSGVDPLDSPLRYPSSISYDPANNLVYFSQGGPDEVPGASPEVWRLNLNTNRLEFVLDRSVFPVDVYSTSTILIRRTDPGKLIVAANVIDDGGRLWEIDVSSIPVVDSSRVTLIAGGGLLSTWRINPFDPQNPPAVDPLDAAMNYIAALSEGDNGEIFVAETGVIDDGRVASVISRLSADGLLSIVAGSGFTGDDPRNNVDANIVDLEFTEGVTVRWNDSASILYLSEDRNHVVRAVNLSSETVLVGSEPLAPGHIRIVAGQFEQPGLTTGVVNAVNEARLGSPFGLSLDEAGNLFITQRDNSTIGLLDIKGQFATIVGNGISGYNGDGPATEVSLNAPVMSTVVDQGVLLIADRENHRIRRLVVPSEIPTLTDAETGDKRPLVCTRACASYRYLGVNGMEIIVFDDFGRRMIILFDPYLSRSVRATGLSTAPATNPANVDQRLDELNLAGRLRQVDFVMLSHSHYDHMADVWELQKRSRENPNDTATGFSVVGSRSAHWLLNGRASLDNESADPMFVEASEANSGTKNQYERIEPPNHLIQPGQIANDELVLPLVVATGFHGLFFETSKVPISGNASPNAAIQAPDVGNDYPEGGSLTYLITVPTVDPNLNYTLYVRGGSGDIMDDARQQPLDFNMLVGLPRLDMAIQCITVYDALDYPPWHDPVPARYLDLFDEGSFPDVYRPEKLIPVHYDNYFDPDPKLASEYFRLDQFEEQIQAFEVRKVVSLRYAGFDRGAQPLDDANRQDEITNAPDPVAIQEIIGIFCGDKLCPFIDPFGDDGL